MINEEKDITQYIISNSIKFGGGVILGISGIILGYTLGSEAVEYSLNFTENKEVLTHIIRTHPILTKIISSYLLGRVGYEFGSFPGEVNCKRLEGKFLRNEIK